MSIVATAKGDHSLSIVCSEFNSRYIRPEVNIPPRSDIEAIDRPTVLYI